MNEQILITNTHPNKLNLNGKQNLVCELLNKEFEEIEKMKEEELNEILKEEGYEN